MVANLLMLLNPIEWWSKLAILQFVDVIEWWSKYGSYPLLN